MVPAALMRKVAACGLRYQDLRVSARAAGTEVPFAYRVKSLIAEWVFAPIDPVDISR